MSIAEAIGSLFKDGMPVRFEAYDGSAVGPPDAPCSLRLTTERGLAYLLTAPGDLGFARAFVAGDLDIAGAHPGNPYPALAMLRGHLGMRVPSPPELVQLLRSVGLSHLRPPAPPPEEHLPRWQRIVAGLRHSRQRDASAIQHHYDVSNRFFEHLLGPSMTYSCAVFATPDDSLAEAQAAKHELVARKLDLKPGARLLDIGCGWGGMVRHAAKHHGVSAIGVTLSREQAAWAREAVEREGLSDLVDIRFSDYRDIAETGFDAVASIGMAEHVGVHNYPSYFESLRSRLRDGGRLLNHCISRRDGQMSHSPGPFIDRYVFPDAELAPIGTMVAAAHDAGLEVRHVETLREHYALTLKAWGENLEANWEQCVDEVGPGAAKVWGLYMAGSRLAFEQNELGVYQTLAVKVGPEGEATMPLRPTWGS
jgi:cyclopropane-fatty-acyl-phospholipid synthase